MSMRTSKGYYIKQSIAFSFVFLLLNGAWGLEGAVDKPVAWAASMGPSKAGASSDSIMQGMRSPAFETKHWLTEAYWYEIVTLAGTGTPGHEDGSLNEAAFRYPTGLFVNGEGDLLAADSHNHMIRKLNQKQASTDAGAWLGEQSAGTPKGGWYDSNAKESLFSEPSAVAEAADGTIYVADTGNHVIRKIDRSGQVTTLAGDGLAGYKDGIGTKARFHAPRGIAIGENGIVYVADSLNHVIRSIDATGKVTTLTAPSARIVEYSKGVVTAAGDYQDGELAKAKFNEPSALLYASSGKLIVSDTGNHRIREIDLMKNEVKTIAGGSRHSSKQMYGDNELYAPGGYKDGVAAQAALNAPAGIAIMKDGSLIVADRDNHSVRMIHQGKVYTIAGHPEEPGFKDGIASYASFHEPTGVAVLPTGEVAVSDSFNNTIRLLKRYQLPQQAGSDLDSGNHALKMVYNQQFIKSDSPPINKEGVTYLPIRALGDAIGITSKWDQKSGKAAFVAVDAAYHFEPDKKTVLKQSGDSETTLTMKQAPFLEKGRLYVPVRFFAEQFGLRVDWIHELNTIVVRDLTYIRFVDQSSS